MTWKSTAMSPKKIFILNGPNLNRLGTREPHIYGHITLAQVKEQCEHKAQSLGLLLDFRQSNFEGEIIQSIHDAIDHGHGIVINPAGLTFTSVSIMDALKMFEGPKIELHISNVHAREATYHHSLMSKAVTAVMAGLGTRGYGLALDWMAERLKE